MLNRWIEDGLLDVLGELGVGCIAFSPLAQGMLTDKYLQGIPEGSRATENSTLSPKLLSDETLAKVTALNEIAAERGQSLAQMALAWTLRDPRVTSALIGASSVPQLEANIARARQARFHPRGADRDRPPRDGERHQPLGRVEQLIDPPWTRPHHHDDREGEGGVTVVRRPAEPGVARDR